MIEYWMRLTMILSECWDLSYCRSRRPRHMKQTQGFRIHDIMRKPNLMTVLLNIFKTLCKRRHSLWVWKSFRTLHWRGAWQLVRLWTPHDNPIPDADIGYYVNFTRFCILTVCSQPIRVLMSNDFKCLEIPHTDAPPKFLYKLSPTKQVINLLAGKYFPVSCRWDKKLLQ